ncbi:hypothetical protein [Streptomyces sp. NPDC087437]|uniref:hypothetical protein n=1 Tax=Streptomyces sp. NPDC087437 TaxID=3365789 RepID=UPI003800558B
MMLIILATAFGALALFVYLLFRQLKDISWQLTQLRVERDSERILHDIGLRTQPPDHGADERARPAHRNRHLALYLGGSLTAVLAELRNLTSKKRKALLASGATAMAALGAIGFLLIAGSREIQPDDEQAIPTDAVSSAPTEPGTLPPDPATSPAALSGAAGDGEDDDSSQAISLTGLASSPPGATGHPPPGTSEDASGPTTRASPTPSPRLPAHTPASLALSDALCVDARDLRELRVCLVGI